MRSVLVRVVEGTTISDRIDIRDITTGAIYNLSDSEITIGLMGAGTQDQPPVSLRMLNGTQYELTLLPSSCYPLTLDYFCTGYLYLYSSAPIEVRLDLK